MVKAEEVKPLAAVGQVHDAGLGRLGLQPQLGQQRGQPRQRGLGLLPAGAHHHRASRRGELHPPALSEPDVSLATHPAPTILQLSGRTPSFQWANRSGSRRAMPARSLRARREWKRSRLYLRMAHLTRISLRWRKVGYNMDL